jgi:hypothetical protein
MPKITFYIPDHEIETIMAWDAVIANPREESVIIHLTVTGDDYEDRTVALKCEDIEIH